MFGMEPIPTNEDIVKYLKNNSLRDELIDWCLSHENFLGALKVMFVHKFVGFNGISISYPKVNPRDEVIGIVVYDLKRKILKQDFIVDNDSLHQTFTLYSKLPNGMTNLYKHGVVESITSFYRKYDRGGKDYQRTHYPDISSLHPELQERINNYLTLTKSQLRNPPS